MLDRTGFGARVGEAVRGIVGGGGGGGGEVGFCELIFAEEEPRFLAALQGLWIHDTEIGSRRAEPVNHRQLKELDSH